MGRHRATTSGLLLGFVLVMLVATVAVGGDPGVGPTPGPSTVPDITAAPLIQTGDPRSDGTGPGIIGSPLAILVGVVLLGLLTVVSTYALARLTQRD